MFCFRFNDNLKQGTSNLVRSLLLQLSSQSHHGHSQLESMRTSHSNSLPPLSTMVETLRCLIQNFKDVYIVLDALDCFGWGMGFLYVSSVDITAKLRRINKAISPTRRSGWCLPQSLPDCWSPNCWSRGPIASSYFSRSWLAQFAALFGLRLRRSARRLLA